MKHILALLVMSAAALAPSAASADTLQYTSSMRGPSEEPPNPSPATGDATIVIDTTAHTMQLTIPFSDLIGYTTAAHIHCCTASPLSGSVAPATTTPSLPGFPLGVTAGTYNATLSLLDPGTYSPAFLSSNGGSPASAEAALLAGLAANTSYLNVHSSTYPNGEIRGFIMLVPEPSSWMMLLAGLGALGWAARSKRPR